MDGFRCILIYRANQVLIDILCQERNHRCCGLAECHKRRIKCHVCVDLILWHILCPITLTTTSDIPVTHIIDKLSECLSCLRNTIITKVIIYGLHHRIKLGEQPLIHHGQLVIVECIFRRIKLVNICIQYIECVRVPECTHELSLSFNDCILMETVWKPRCGVAVEVPADRICTIFVQGIHRIYRVTLGLTHLLSVLILYVTKHDNVLVRRLVKEQCGDCHQGIEPSSCLVNCLTDEVSREVVLEDILILKRIMPLCKWHRTGIEPAVDNLRYTLHLAATIRTLDRHCINVWTVQLDIIRAVVAHGFQFLDGTDCMTLTTRALPDIQWSTPVTVTG